MDFLVVLAEWLDLAFSTIGIGLFFQLYRQRQIMSDAVWWVRAHHRQEWIQRFLDAAIRNHVQKPVEMLITLSVEDGHPLSEAEQFFARQYHLGLEKGEDAHEETSKAPA